MALSDLTRPHWGGEGSDQDIHLEIYENEIDTAFQYNAIFKSLSAQRSTAEKSNNYRIDRLNTSKVMSRKSGDEVLTQKTTSDKFNIYVDTVLYIKEKVDYADDWTAPDFLKELGENHGTEMAIAFDQAHIIQLIKARNWKAPAAVKDAFKDGIEILAPYNPTASTKEEVEANAIALYAAHSAAVTELIKRRVPLNEHVTLVTPEVFSALLEHPKVMNQDFTSGNDYASRRLVKINGVDVIECTEFPQVAGTHPLGADYTVTTEDLGCQMILFSKKSTLVTVEAKGFTTRQWDNMDDHNNVIECFAMYNVGIRRGDNVAVVNLTAPAP